MRAVASGFSYGFRVAAVGLITTIAAASLTATTAEAKKRGKGAKSSHRAKVVKVKFNPPYAAIVVDANSGKVLHESSADAPRHPASITKVMTLYLMFERLEAGKIHPGTEMPVSARAAAQAPSKLGLKAGQTLRVDDAIRALVTKSANDAAVVVAEALGDSEPHFARMMTQKARALGMHHTLYRNASGLPNDEQITTARDQALLGRAIQDRFPKHYRYFATTAFTYKGRAMRNHNKLLGSLDGVDGIKTGYVNASGYNLLASMKRDNRHLVAVVMGGRSGKSRDARMRELLSGHVKVAAAKRTTPIIVEGNEIVVASRAATAAGGGSIGAPAPASGPAAIATQEAAPPAATVVATAQVTADKHETTTATVTGGGSGGDLEPIRVKTVKVKASMLPSMAIGQAHAQPAAPRVELQVQAPPAAEGKTSAGAPIVVAKAAAPAPEAPVTTQASLRSPGSEWMIQVGALETQADANERIANARAKAAKFLAKAKSFTEPIIKADVRLWRARFAGISKDDAEAACKTLKSAKIVCIPIKH
jgi:D-alanyl-D-alanine carboxypeptidase